MKIKKTIDGKEVEIEISQDEALSALELDNKANAGKTGIITKLRTLIGVSDEEEEEGTKGKKTVDPEVKQLKEMVKSLADALREEKEARKIATETIEKSSKEARSKEIKAMVADAIKVGKITPADEAKWISRLEKDLETNKEVLAELPASTKAPAKEPGSPSSQKKEEAGTYSVEDYLSNPGKYSELAKAELSTESK